jgi:hypothetical protein
LEEKIIPRLEVCGPRSPEFKLQYHQKKEEKENSPQK